MTINDIICEIDEDIEVGIYLNFPDLRKRLQHIREKLFKMKYIVNNDYKLSFNECKTLEENSYIDDAKDFYENQ